MLVASRVVFHCFAILLAQGVAIGDYIRHYVPLVLPRLVQNGREQRLSLDANGRVFDLILRSKWAVLNLNTNFTIVGPKGSEKLDPSQLLRTLDYEGEVDSVPRSYLSGKLRNGIFEGFFRIENKTYHVEPYSRYFSQGDHLYNAILYEVRDVVRSCSDVDAPSDASAATKIRFRRRRIPHSKTPRRSTFWPTVPTTPFEAYDNEYGIPVHLCKLKIVVDFRVWRHVVRGDVNDAVRRIEVLLRYADEALRELDLTGSRSDRFGIYAATFQIYTEPVDESSTEVTAWNPSRFFRELRRYDFRNHCGGLLFTYRMLEPASEKYGPSQLPVNWLSPEDDGGMCSTRPVTVPQISVHNYGPHFSNALPVNFYFKHRVATEASMKIQVLHQVGHLFGMNEAEVGLCHPFNVHEWAIGAFPMNPGTGLASLRFTKCDIDDIKNNVLPKLPCLQSCYAPGCTQPLQLPKPVTVTVVPPPDPWSTICWNETVNDGAGSTEVFFGFWMIAILGHYIQ